MPYVEHDGVHLFYLLEGYGSESILLLHGWCCDMHDWSFQIPMLVARGFTTITMDTRGHGRSTLPASSPDSSSSSSSSTSYSASTLASDAVALLTHLQISQVVVAGHSTGTVVASILALHYPDLVRGLILLDPAYYLYERERENLVEGLQTPDAPERAASLFARRLYTPATPAYLKAWHMRRARSTPAEAVSGLLRGHFGAGKEGLWEVMSVVGVGRKGPRFVVCGSEEHAERERGLGVSKGDQVHVVAAGSWPHQQAAEEVNALLGRWLETDLYEAYT